MINCDQMAGHSVTLLHNLIQQICGWLWFLAGISRPTRQPVTVDSPQQMFLSLSGNHGTQGEWKVSVANLTPVLREFYFQAVEELGLKRLRDFSGKEQEGE